MKFEEAIKEMKKGNKVKRKSDGRIISRENYGSGLYYEHSNTGKQSTCFTSADIEANDWEVVEDDWNLAECESVYKLTYGDGNTILSPKSYKEKDVKKCRDYLREDADKKINDVYEETKYRTLSEFIKYLEIDYYIATSYKLFQAYRKGVLDQRKDEEKRFGDL